MAVTTSESIKRSRGEYCAVCKERKPIVRWSDPIGGYVCPADDPDRQLIQQVPDDTPLGPTARE